jgi:GT2 family glycosyltransferase
MQEEKHITASIVVYKEDPAQLQKIIDTFFEYSFSRKIYIIDNSPTNILKDKINGDRIDYLFSGTNLGFGKGHNTILDSLKKQSNYHLILNPDICFSSKILNKLTDQLQKDQQLSMVAPKVLYPAGELQYTARKFPTVLELFCRFMGIFKIYTNKKEYKDEELTAPFFPDFVQGSFMLFKTKDFIELKGFDERYFMYMEDIDICRKIDLSGKRKLYFPATEIIHSHRKGSSKELRLFCIHISSIIKYFMKWGFNSA